MEDHNPQAETSFKPLTVSSKRSAVSTPDPTKITAYATERARLLFGCYRKGDANDPETYVAAITATLARYPEDVIRAVTHPATGLPIQKDFLPTVREVYLACEAVIGPRREAQARRERTERQLAERAEWEAIHRSFAKDSAEAKALTVLHEIVEAMDFFKKICVQRDGNIVYPKQMTPRVEALALAPERQAWVQLTHQQAGAWEAMLRDCLTLKVRRYLKEGSRAPWAWPPSQEGNIYPPDSTGPPPAELTEQDMADFK